MAGHDPRSIRAAAPLALLALALAAACGGAEPAGSTAGSTPDRQVDLRAGLDEPFRLPYHGRADVRDGALRVEFRAIAEESRCPADVQCVSAGNAAAVFGIDAADGGTATITLNTLRGPREAAVQGYRVRLDALDPAPAEAGVPIDSAAYVATLTVRRAGP